MYLHLPVPPGRRPPRIAVCASLVIVAALIGCTPNAGAESHSISTSIRPSASESAAPPPATYSLAIDEIAPIQVVLNLADGWSRGGWVVVKNAAHLGLFPVANVYTDPCHWSGTLPEPPVGPSVEDLAAALVAQPTRNATAVDITVGGFGGKLVSMSVPDINFADCDSGLFASWSEAGSDAPSRYAHGPGELEDVYVIDVEGTRVVIDVAHMPSTSAADLAELEAMVDSIRIE